MKYSDKITFVIFAFNEESRIERVIRNLRDAGKVLVVDNHSTDRTRELATSFGAEVLLHKNPGWVEDEGTVAVVKAAVDTPWIYWAFTDEMIDERTKDALVDAVESGRYRIVSMVRKNYYYGRFCHDAFSNRMNRVFEKDAIDFTGNTIHHFGKTAVADNLILQLDSDLFVHHFISNTAKSYLGSMDRYSDIDALRQMPLSTFRHMVRSLKTFASNYFLKGGRKAGSAGLFLALQMIYYDMLVLMKGYEHRHSLSTGSIEGLNNKVRDAILNASSAQNGVASV